MAKTVKQAKADIYLRDTDSQGQYNNSGVLVFLYFHEWNDCYNPTTGKTAQIDGEVYDEETGAYKPDCPEGYSPVFNGRLSALWDNMVACFPERVQGMYKTMRDNGLSYKDMMGKYKELWRYWCENLYNADAFGYMNTNNFTKAYGDKMQVMDFFFQKRQRYMDSKYCCGSSASNNLRLRLYETGKGLAIKYYQAIYSSLQWGANNFSTKRNIEPGTYSYMPFGFNNPQDATFDIDDADLITELSTYTKSSDGYTITGMEGLGDFKFDLNMGLLKRLTKFVMNYTVAKPNTKEQGDNFDLSGMKMLRQVIVRNVRNLKKSIVIGSDMVEEIDFTNTPIVGVSTPPSDSLVSLVLPDTITSLKLKGYAKLTDKGLQVAGYGNIDEFEVEDCPNLDTFALLEKCHEAGAPLTQTTLKGIDWTLDDTGLLLTLARNGARLQGKITMQNTVKVTAAMVQELMSAWGDITDESNSLYISYAVEEINAVGITGKGYLGAKGDYQYTISVTPTSGNNIKSVDWSIGENPFATISKAGVVSVNAVGTEENDDKVAIRLVVTTTTGEEYVAEKELGIYRRACRLGDYVFSDGSYGSSLDDSTLTPVGVVFYIEPKKREKAIAATFDRISRYRSNEYLNWSHWGLYQSLLPGITLKDNPLKDPYFVDADNVCTATTSVSIENMIDEDNVSNDGFKAYPKTNNLGDIGFTTIDEDTYTQYRKYLRDIGLEAGDMIANGQLRTIKIIAHRDMVLTDSGVNLPVPKAGDGVTEADSLYACNANVIAGNNNNNEYYYMPASECWAYTPLSLKGGEEVAECLKPHHWFLGSAGELSRLYFYMKNANTGNKYDILAKAVKEANFQVFTFTDSFTCIVSSTEYSIERVYTAQSDINTLRKSLSSLSHHHAMVTINIK